MEQKPSIGRVIVYNNPGSKDETYPPTQSPALIVKVNEDSTVLAHVFTIHRQRLIHPANSQARRWPLRVELDDKNLTSSVRNKKALFSRAFPRRSS